MTTYEAALRRFDLAALATLTLTTSLFMYRFLHFSVPEEDAAILMRYAQNIAQGHGIVWNIGGPPVDGGTDFLSMIAMAAIVRLGVSPPLAAYVMGLACHLLTAAIIFLAATKIGKLPIVIGELCAAYFLCGPGLLLISAGFTTPVFVLAVAAPWYLCLKLIVGKPAEGPVWSLAFAFLAMGLTRPEGVLLAGFMVLAILSMQSIRDVARPLAATTCVFLILGGAYFIWRWEYFGYPLPNPYYRKGGFALHPAALVASIRNAAALLFMLVLAFILGLKSSASRRLAIATSIPIVLLTAIWVLVSDEMDYMMRFQYPILPIALMSAPLILKGSILEVFRPTSTSRASQRVAIGLAAIWMVVGFAGLFRIDRQGTLPDDDKVLVGQALRPYGSRRVMATTEAGLLPLYSEWTVLDTWGLNDPWIAHHGGLITEQYLGGWNPDLIAMHRSLVSSTQPPGPAWDAMLAVLQKYTATHRYKMAAAAASSTDVMLYYVREGAPDASRIAESIRAAVAQSNRSDRTIDYSVGGQLYRGRKP